MSDLGEFLESMHTSARRWTSLRLEGIEWRHLATLGRAWENHLNELRKTHSVKSFSAVRLDTLDGRAPPQETRESWRVWMAKPDKRRAQFQVGDEIVTAVFVGDWWWGWSPSRGFITNNGSPSQSHDFGPAEGLVDPARHLASLDLRVDGRTSLMGRPAFLASATARNVEPGGFDRTLHLLGTGADEYKIVVDAETGIWLRCEALYEGASFRVIQVDEFGVDEVFPQNVFDPELLRAGTTNL